MLKALFGIFLSFVRSRTGSDQPNLLFKKQGKPTLSIAGKHSLEGPSSKLEFVTDNKTISELSSRSQAKDASRPLLPSFYERGKIGTLSIARLRDEEATLWI